ncbi:MAG TPA: MmcQ/YjbR family DNA-binding protein [Chitinophagaceae bacterium]|nr:MmcQ/YjbR family DNA-binding protein [Chitinophagaceae bacterium]
MISTKVFRELAMALPGVVEQPHFEKASFRVGGKIFATLDEAGKLASCKLSLKDQDLFSLFDKKLIHAVPNKWGQQGWTMVHFSTLRKPMLRDLLTAAYLEVAPEKLAIQVKETK